MKRIALTLLTIAIVAFAGSASYAKERTDDKKLFAEVSIQSVDNVLVENLQMNRVNTQFIEVHGISYIVRTYANNIVTVAELRDPGFTVRVDETDKKAIPPTRYKQLKARALIRGVLKHPKGSN